MTISAPVICSGIVLLPLDPRFVRTTKKGPDGTPAYAHHRFAAAYLAAPAVRNPTISSRFMDAYVAEGRASVKRG